MRIDKLIPLFLICALLLGACGPAVETPGAMETPPVETALPAFPGGETPAGTLSPSPAPGSEAGPEDGAGGSEGGAAEATAEEDSGPEASPTATTAPAEPAPWWEQAVFYEIFVRSFFDSDGDGIGDFNGLAEKLDYLNDGDPETTGDLGVQGLWLMPIFPSPSYHGYDVADYYNTNPDYGTLEDFRSLLEQAHARGIRVIIDLPVNHTSTEISWFQESRDPQSPYRDWYTWVEQEPEVIGPWGQDVWHPGAGGGYYYGVFDDIMPDLNYQNPEVRAEIGEIVRFWLEEVQVDGFRLDGARYYVEEGEVLADTPGNHEWLEELRRTIKEIDPEALIVGEVWTVSFTVAGYLEGDELDLAFDFDRASATLNSANSGRAASALSQLSLSTGRIPAGRYASFLTNHDQDRVMSDLGGKVEKARLAAALLLTGPSTPFIYYGEEIGMTGSGSHEAVRTPMQWCAEPGGCFTAGQPWTPVHADTEEHNVAGQAEDPDSLLSLYRALVHLRSQHPALQAGAETLEVRASASSVYAVLRQTEQQTALVLVNLGTQPVEDLTLSLRTGPLSGSYTMELLFGEPAPVGALQPNERGGFDGFQPIPALPAGAVMVFELASQP